MFSKHMAVARLARSERRRSAEREPRAELRCDCFYTLFPLDCQRGFVHPIGNVSFLIQEMGGMMPTSLQGVCGDDMVCAL